MTTYVIFDDDYQGLAELENAGISADDLLILCRNNMSSCVEKMSSCVEKQERIALAVSLRKQGYSIGHIAQKLDRTGTCVRNYLRGAL